MLISQRIAQDLSFLKVAATKESAKHYKAFVFDLRLRIMRATKIIVGTEFLDYDRSINYHEIPTFSDGKLCGVPLTDPPISPSELKKIMEDLDRRYERYTKYCRLPFRSVAFENERGLYLVEEGAQQHFTIHCVASTGTIHLAKMTVDVSQLHVAPLDNLTYIAWAEKDIHIEGTLDYIDEVDVGFSRRMHHIAQTAVFKVLDTILHFNVANSRIHEYRLSSKEAKLLPKAMVSHYIYRILDVFRDRIVYHSLKDVEDFAKVTDRSTMRKAHLVRGHFKEISNKLYWWNEFVRCRKGAGDAGIVVKDYSLH